MPERDFDVRYRNIAFVVVASATVVGAAILVLPFLPAIMWATVFSVLMHRFYGRLCRRFNSSVSSGLTVLATLALIVLPIAAIGVVIGAQAIGVLSELRAANPDGNSIQSSDLLHRLDDLARPIADSVGATDFQLSAWLKEHGEDIGRQTFGPLGKIVVSIGFGIFTLVVSLLTMFFMLRDGPRLREPALELIPLPRERAEELLKRMADTIRAVFEGVVFVALIQGVVAGIAYWLAGAPTPVLLALATTILCVIPLLGAPFIYVPVGLSLIAQGKVVGGVAVLVVGFGLISNLDNLLRPFFIGARVPLHPMAIFFSLLGGVFAMGPIGIMAGPVLLTLLLGLQEIVRNRRAASAAPAGEAKT